MAQVWTYAITAAVRRGDRNGAALLDPDLCHDAAARRGRVQAGRPLPTRNGQSRWALLAPATGAKLTSSVASRPTVGTKPQWWHTLVMSMSLTAGRGQDVPGGESR